MRKIITLCCLLSLAFAGFVYADGIDALIELGRSQQEIQKTYQAETSAYSAVEKGIKSGSIARGTPKSDVLRYYGEPVIAVSIGPNKTEKWAYKPATSGFMDGGPRICLYFNDKGLLDKIETAE